MLATRIIQTGMVASIALFFNLAAFDNIFNFNANWIFIQHVLSMDTTFHDPAIMWRAITHPGVQKIIYCCIILTELSAALFCWVGAYILMKHFRQSENNFHSAKKIAFIGLFLGFLLYAVGFIAIAGEWFSMWQSQQWNGQTAAGLFLNMIMFVMIFLNMSSTK